MGYQELELTTKEWRLRVQVRAVRQASHASVCVAATQPLKDVDRLPLKDVDRLPLKDVDRFPLKDVDGFPLKDVDRLPLKD
eukprot:1304260-Prymnesium_polylepis.1